MLVIKPGAYKFCAHKRQIPRPCRILDRYANRSARFINAYSQGLSGPEAAWANRKYHGHRCLPPDILADLKKEFEKKYGGDK